MEFHHKYHGSSGVRQSPTGTGISFAPDVLREPTFFVGALGGKLPYREAMSALHEVVKSDLRFKRDDKNEYKAWAKTQEDLWLAEYQAKLPDLKTKIGEMQAELKTLQTERQRVMGPFYKAQQEWFRYIRKRDYDAWFVLDPVITVHPDELFFECFSQDESTYGKLSCDYNIFEKIDSFECGTTNVDYSTELYTEFQKIRSYKSTELRVDPSGFEVATEREDTFKEEKIDLPDSWVRGFLQVSTAMTLPSVTLDLHPTDLMNLLFVLRRNRAKRSPRYLQFQLEPGQPIRMDFQPWNLVVDCPRSIYTGPVARTIKLWGRRRLFVLERLLPLADSVRVHLLGDGQPSFFIVKMGDLTFTLGLSGWTANDWSRAGQFNLLNAPTSYEQSSMDRVYRILKTNWRMSTDELSQATGYDRPTIHGIMSEHAREGNAIYDLNKQVYRARELSKDGIPLETLRFVSEVEQTAFALEVSGQVRVTQHDVGGEHELLRGTVTDKEALAVELLINADKQLVGGKCSCNFARQNGLKKGPCAHMVALRMQAGA